MASQLDTRHDGLKMFEVFQEQATRRDRQEISLASPPEDFPWLSAIEVGSSLQRGSLACLKSLLPGCVAWLYRGCCFAAMVFNSTAAH